ncbi:MAG: ArsR family transcriptional regulator [Candidatus Bathyarchaeota archaeon]|nr:MAG: ArsR family transcriptional regulator [Candidatus Bathyarchaeota archaeon]
MREDLSSGFSSGPEMPDELRLLCMLHNIGATESGRSLNVQQISEWTKMDAPTLQFHLQRLSELGYVQFVQTEGTDKYHLTINGIRKVLSMYS